MWYELQKMRLLGNVPKRQLAKSIPMPAAPSSFESLWQFLKRCRTAPAARHLLVGAGPSDLIQPTVQLAILRGLGRKIVAGIRHELSSVGLIVFGRDHFGQCATCRFGSPFDLFLGLHSSKFDVLKHGVDNISLWWLLGSPLRHGPIMPRYSPIVESRVGLSDAKLG